MGVYLNDLPSGAENSSPSPVDKMETCRQAIDKFKNEKGFISAVHHCRWCMTARVATKGDICHNCADGVERQGMEFESDEGIPYARYAVWLLVGLLGLIIVQIFVSGNS